MKDKEYQMQFNAYKNASVQLRQKYETEQLKHSTAQKQLLTAHETSKEMEQELEDVRKQNEKQAKGTRLVICLQNYVRKMLQEKLEATARQLAAVSSNGSSENDSVNILNRQANLLEEDQIKINSGVVAVDDKNENDKPIESSEK